MGGPRGSVGPGARRLIVALGAAGRRGGRWAGRFTTLRPVARFWQAWPSNATALLAGVTAFGLTSGAGHAHGTADLGLYLGAGLATLAAGGISANNQRLQSRDAASATRAVDTAELGLRLAIGDSLDPIVQLLARVQTTPHTKAKESLRGVAQAAVLGAATVLARGDRVRACYFTLAEADSTRPRRLEPRAHVGRSQEPTPSSGRAPRKVTPPCAWLTPASGSSAPT